MLDRRKAELGINYERKPIPDGYDKATSNANAGPLIFEDGDTAEEMRTKASKQSVVELLDLDLEEQRDAEAVKACMKKY